jgi:type VI protein secretion system component VasK
MITQLQWIYASIAVIYAIVGAWTFGYVKAKRSTDSFDAFICGTFFPIYLVCAWALAPIAEMGKRFSKARIEKKDREEAHAREAQEHLEAAEQELDEELNRKAA